MVGVMNSCLTLTGKSRPFQGWFAIRALALATIILPNKKIVCHPLAMTCYRQPIYQIRSLYLEDMKGDTKYGLG